VASTSHIETPVRVQASALNHYIKKKISTVDRHSVFMGMMRSKGRLAFRKDGQQLEWRPRATRRRMVPGQGSPANITFQPTQTKKICRLPWRSYDLGEVVTKFEILATQGKSGWFKILTDVIDEMAGDFNAHFGEKFYIDGNATATNTDLHGLESWFSTTGSCVSNSLVGNPNDSYAGHSTALGVTGSWTPESGNGWPTGVGHTNYHWFSPLVVDYNNTGFGGSTADWTHQWQDAFAYGLTYLKILAQGEAPICIMSPNLLQQAKRSLKDNQRFSTTADSALVKLGHKTLEYDGVEIADEYGVPEAVAYLLDFSKLNLWSMQDDIIGTSRDFDIETQETRLALDSYVQMWTESPKFHCKLEGISTAGT